VREPPTVTNELLSFVNADMLKSTQYCGSDLRFKGELVKNAKKIFEHNIKNFAQSHSSSNLVRI